MGVSSGPQGGARNVPLQRPNTGWQQAYADRPGTVGASPPTLVPVLGLPSRSSRSEGQRKLSVRFPGCPPSPKATAGQPSLVSVLGLPSRSSRSEGQRKLSVRFPGCPPSPKATAGQPSLVSVLGLPSRSSRSERRLERVVGIEPASSAWKAAALPLCYTRARAEPFSRFGRRRRGPVQHRLH